MVLTLVFFREQTNIVNFVYSLGERPTLGRTLAVVDLFGEKSRCPCSKKIMAVVNLFEEKSGRPSSGRVLAV